MGVLSSGEMGWPARCGVADTPATGHAVRVSDLALVEEATRRSGVLWVAPHGGREQAVWHVWHAGAAYVVTGGREQPWPGGGDRVLVVVRSRERQAGRVAQWEAIVEPVPPRSALWDDVVPLLHARRLNAPDGPRQPQRWAAESQVLRLVPQRVVPGGDQARLGQPGGDPRRPDQPGGTARGPDRPRGTARGPDRPRGTARGPG